MSRRGRQKGSQGSLHSGQFKVCCQVWHPHRRPFLYFPLFTNSPEHPGPSWSAALWPWWHRRRLGSNIWAGKRHEHRWGMCLNVLWETSHQQFWWLWGVYTYASPPPLNTSERHWHDDGGKQDITAPLHCWDLHSGRVVGAILEGYQLRVLLLGRDLDHRVQRLPGLDVGEAPPGGDLPQAVHVGGGDQQVAGGEEARGQRWWLLIPPRAAWKLWLDETSTTSPTHLGNMWPVSFTSLHGMWCFTSGLLIQVWMLTISFLSSSDMDELSISSEEAAADTRQDIELVTGFAVVFFFIYFFVYLCHTPLHPRYWRRVWHLGTVCRRGRCCWHVCQIGRQSDSRCMSEDSQSSLRRRLKRHNKLLFAANITVPQWWVNAVKCKKGVRWDKKKYPDSYYTLVPSWYSGPAAIHHFCYLIFLILDLSAQPWLSSNWQWHGKRLVAASLGTHGWHWASPFNRTSDWWVKTWLSRVAAAAQCC